VLIVLVFFKTMLPVVSYGCEIWSLTLRDEYREWVMENRVLRRIYGSKRDEVRGEWKGVYKEEFNDLYCLPNIIRVIKPRIIRWVGHVARMGEWRGAYTDLVGRGEGKRPLGRCKRK
jgi:hypothetical protein